jgi:hypothetical protein
MTKTRSTTNIDITTRLEKLEDDLNTNNQLLSSLKHQIDELNHRQ